MPNWKCDKCGHEFDLDDFPEECPSCKADDGTFSLIE